MEGTMGEIRLFGGNFAPRNWAYCEGQLMSIAANTALFSLLGTTYGGDGRTTFGIPDLRSRVAVGVGQADSGTIYDLGEKGGIENETLTVSQMPSHTHDIAIHLTAQAGLPSYNDEANSSEPSGAGYALPNNDLEIYNVTANNVMGTVTGTYNATVQMGNAGASYPHSNEQPSLGMNFIICTAGIFPSRN
ncbi:MAG: phage tail protein [Chitinophagaceae bacterium]|nr:phage tail protein [Chitinophagaceae bacterium]